MRGYNPAVDAREMIDRLGLDPHPEGGWYRETWRGPVTAGGRASATAICFLLEGGAASRWHRVDADEIWVWHGGSALELWHSPEGREPERVVLGIGLGRSELPHAVVPAGEWQSARALGEWTLVGCIVIPGFTFEGFELAPENWRPGSPRSHA